MPQAWDHWAKNNVEQYAPNHYCESLNMWKELEHTVKLPVKWRSRGLICDLGRIAYYISLLQYSVCSVSENVNSRRKLIAWKENDFSFVKAESRLLVNHCWLTLAVDCCFYLAYLWTSDVTDVSNKPVRDNQCGPSVGFTLFSSWTSKQLKTIRTTEPFPHVCVPGVVAALTH